MRVMSWNVNSVRARLDHVMRVVESHAPDVLCLQETKVDNARFPLKAFEGAGYVHHALNGQKGHHGVAILSRMPITPETPRDWCAMGDARHAVAHVAGVTVHNFYVPAGGDEPDPAINPKFAHKLDFLSEMRHWAQDLTGPALLVGDLNVAPLAEDVWSHKQLLKVVTHTPVETQALSDVQVAHGFEDLVRRFRPAPEKLFSWWSYRARDWRASNRGRRLDHIWASPDLAGRATGFDLVQETRDWDKPSDHIPLLVDLEP
ncbi:exodeoxyribonuclease III [Yunchengibacter salinarum]|uniref:exodeoxyribonuclease III n=1 Tax=Yunchengibacter salinarum TaxID=3133399 RepID=UPI0035B57BB8